MSLSQYEKVIQSYKSGVYIPSGDFSMKMCNTWVKQYNKNFDKMTPKQWEDTLNYYSITPKLDSERLGDQSILDEGCVDLPMSP
jgi:hypothetical protein